MLFGNGQTLTLPGSNGGVTPSRAVFDSAGIQEGFIFLQSELEKRDPTLYEPLTSVTWARDIVANTGGGPVDFTSLFFADFGTSGANMMSFAGTETNDIPVVQAKVQKNTYNVFNWQMKTRVPYIEMQKLNQVGRSLDAMYNDGLRLNYNKTLDQATYLGSTDFDTTGLLNDPNVIATLAAANGTGNARTFASKTADQILTEINALITRCWARAEYDTSALPNHIGLPPQVFSSLNTRLVSTAGSISILEYLLRNNISRTQGVDLQIVPMRQLVGIGTPLTSGGANTDRMIAYVNEKRFVEIDLPLPLQRTMTQPSVTEVAYISHYWAQIGVVKYKYYQPVEYLDGI